MTNFIEKARANRIIALNLHRSGAVMFFPSEIIDEAETSCRSITEISKPMFVRSADLHPSAMIATPAADNIASEPFILTEEFAVDEEDRRAA